MTNKCNAYALASSLYVESIRLIQGCVLGMSGRAASDVIGLQITDEEQQYGKRKLGCLKSSLLAARNR